ncbi:MAG: hypothetical protein LAP86_23805 [Acidobacteriia bacterium]|nr:hypothetical protein [Terriglobia bacterium]
MSQKNYNTNGRIGYEHIENASVATSKSFTTENGGAPEVAARSAAVTEITNH